MAYTSRQLIFPPLNAVCTEPGYYYCSFYIWLERRPEAQVDSESLLLTQTAKARWAWCLLPCPWSHKTTLNKRGPRRDSASGVSSSEQLTLNYSQAVLQTNTGSCSCVLRQGEEGTRSRRICPWQLHTRPRTSTGCGRSCRVLHQASSQMAVQPAHIPNTETGKVVGAPVRPVPGLDRMVL